MRFIQTLGFVSCAFAAALPVDFERRDVAGQDVAGTVGKVVTVPGAVVNGASGVLQRDAPIVGDVPTAAEKVGGVPGKVVGTAGNVISRDLPVVGDTLSSVETVPGSV
ncbi:hypothetical protein A1F97_06487, partial [Pyrenophora tritici-repentis]